MNIQIQTTTICNAKCIICPYKDSWFSKNHNHMDDDTFNIIIDKLKNIKISRICPYLMNEPLTDPKLFERIEKIKNKLNFGWIEISTNAALLTQEKADKLINSLEGVNHEIIISFQGYNKESYENIMKLKFKKTLEQIIYLINKIEFKPIHIRINGCGTPMSSNAKTYFTNEQYQNFWVNTFNKYNIMVKPPIKFFQYTDRSGQIKDNFNYKRIKMPMCSRLTNWLHILYNGEATICCNDYKKKYIVGNIKKETPQQILNSTKINNIKNKYTNIHQEDDNFICKKCSLRP